MEFNGDASARLLEVAGAPNAGAELVVAVVVPNPPKGVPRPVETAGVAVEAPNFSPGVAVVVAPNEAPPKPPPSGEPNAPPVLVPSPPPSPPPNAGVLLPSSPVVTAGKPVACCGA